MAIKTVVNYANMPSFGSMLPEVMAIKFDLF